MQTVLLFNDANDILSQTEEEELPDGGKNKREVKSEANWESNQRSARAGF